MVSRKLKMQKLKEREIGGENTEVEMDDRGQDEEDAEEKEDIEEDFVLQLEAVLLKIIKHIFKDFGKN